MNQKQFLRHQSGFTLVELAIVLVIIGLLVGGVLVGTDLIKSARINAQISQLDAFRAAFNTFRDKYGGLPGDITPARAGPFGFATRSGKPGSGDGNGLLQSGNNAGTAVYTSLLVAGETALVWTDLGQAGLIPGTFLGKDCTQASGACTDTVNYTGTNAVSSVIPQAKMGDNFYLAAAASGGKNLFMLLANAIISYNGDLRCLSNTCLPDLTPTQAIALDSKTDDGYPATGTVLSLDNYPWTDPFPLSTTGANKCVVAGTPATYNTTSSTYRDQPLCILTFPT